LGWLNSLDRKLESLLTLQAWAVLWGMSLGREGHSGVFQAQTGSLDQKVPIQNVVRGFNEIVDFTYRTNSRGTLLGWLNSLDRKLESLLGYELGT
jgi:hypothetical protein